MQISSALYIRLKAMGLFLALYGAVTFFPDAWDDLEFLTGKTFPTLDLAWTQLLSAAFLTLTIVMAAFALKTFLQERRVYEVPTKETPEAKTGMEAPA